MATWNFHFFYQNHPNGQAKEDLTNTLSKAKALKDKYFSILSDPILKATTLKKFFEDYSELLSTGYLAFQYAHLNYSKDTTNKDAQEMFGIAMDRMTKIDTELSFWKPVLLSQSIKTLKEFQKNPDLCNYEHVLHKLIDSKKHVLSVSEESILSAMKNCSINAFSDLYGSVTDGYEFPITINSEEKILTGSQVRALRFNTNQSVRQNAMKKFFSRYENDKVTISKTYNAIAKQWDLESSLRNFSSPIHRKNLDNEIQNDTVDTLIKTTSNQTSLVQKYYSWKAKKLNINMSLADIYAPLNQNRKEVPFEEAKKIVLEAYSNFDPEFGTIVEKFFEEGRVDSDIRKGKRGGAFCSYVIPNQKPFVLVNYTGNARDLMTLAHELGHGIHGTLSSDQNIWNYHTPLTMAEIASVFGEMILMDHILPTLEENEKTAFIASKMEDMIATTFRQNMFTEFEVKSHALIQDKSSANWDTLSEIYYNELKNVFGTVVSIPEEYSFEWATIPHVFRTPFYVYAYNFANLLVIALYQQYKKMGQTFIPLYKDLLRSGGKESPEILLAKLGINLKDAKFWEQGFQYMDNEFIKKLEKMN